MATRRKQPARDADAIDEMVEESFPASDPPAYASGFSLGAPAHEAGAASQRPTSVAHRAPAPRKD